VPVHLQQAYADLGYLHGEFPVTERITGRILSLPMYPQLRDEELATVATAVRRFFA
jgi:dTDP-4-amino-4,6-dideoxygalactose transaminase